MEKTVVSQDNDSATVDLLNTLTNKGEKKKKKTFGNVTVERTDGEKIILPHDMDYREARLWLERIEKSEESLVNFSTELKAYPWDGAYALFRAMQEQFGFADMIAEKGPSGDTPPTMISIKLPDGSYVSVPWGRMSFPGFDEKCYLETGYNNQKMMFMINGVIRKKFKAAIDRLTSRTERILKESSIYKGNAIRVDLKFLETGESITQPEFLNHSISSIKKEEILLTDVVNLNYSSVLLRIEQTKDCIRKSIPLKHGCLLAGPYGTGKTLLAKYTGKISIENGWTFIYLENVLQLKNALRLAEMYAPAVVFAEDIDKAVEGQDRSHDINSILNTLDGIDTKSNPIITILTTNHLENINKAFLRAGRIDSLVRMGPLEKSTGMQFLRIFTKDTNGESLLDETLVYDSAAESLTGIVPAFAYEVINKAKMYAMFNKRELITPEDIEIAAASFKEHIKLTSEKSEDTKEEKFYKSAQFMADTVVGAKVLELEEQVKELTDELRS